MNPGELLVIVPSRGRPDNAKRFIDAFVRTSVGAWCTFVVDKDDPSAPDYPVNHKTRPRGRPGMVDALNTVATETVEDYAGKALGFCGDDHLMRSLGWDAAVAHALTELGTGIVYCNDLFQGRNLPTAVFMTADIVRALGYMAPPMLRHLYVDDTWKAWGEGIDRLRYLEDIVVEHIHPAAGKTEWTPQYLEVNNAEFYASEAAAYGTYRASGLEADLAKLRALL